MGKQWKQWLTLLFWAPKITADGDCSHEIKRRLLLGRKVMTNLDSILKSRDITLPTKVRLVKAMVFPVVMYGCQSCIIKKAERWRIDGFELWCWRRLLRVPWTAEIQPVRPKGNQSWIFTGRTDAETPILWNRPQLRQNIKTLNQATLSHIPFLLFLWPWRQVSNGFSRCLDPWLTTLRGKSPCIEYEAYTKINLHKLLIFG